MIFAYINSLTPNSKNFITGSRSSSVNWSGSSSEKQSIIFWSYSRNKNGRELYYSQNHSRKS